MTRLSLTCFLWLLTACQGAAPLPKDRRPRLVISIVLDQFGSWVLKKHFDALPEDGAIKSIARGGVFHERVSYAYAETTTAAGHAAIYTGMNPDQSGIWGNHTLDRLTNKLVAAIEDDQYPAFGAPRSSGSPMKLKVETVGDALKRQSHGKSKVLSVSHKIRGSVIPGGKQADLALWYEHTLPGFTTSNYYASASPQWLRDWTSTHPVSTAFSEWKAQNPTSYQTRLGNDDQPGESHMFGGSAAFPHNIQTNGHPEDVFTSTPASVTHMLALIREGVTQLAMGQDQYPDLLAISVSTTDLIGHNFGVESWEYLDNLIQVDRALGSLLRDLEKTGPIAVLITSDHGSAPLPERTRARGLSAGRVHISDIRKAVEGKLDQLLGDGDWVLSITPPYIYLTDAARARPDRKEIAKAVQAVVSTMQGIAQISDVQDILRWKDRGLDTVRRAVKRSVPKDCTADFFIVPRRYWFLAGQAEEGTTHGSPYDYDTDVPVLIKAPGIQPLHTTEPQEQRRVASTLSTLLGIQPPKYLFVPPLPGVPQIYGP